MTKMIYVKEIKWERVFLHLTLESEIEDEILEFRLRSGRLKITTPPLKHEKTGEREYRLIINITAANGNSFLDNSNWNVIAYIKDSDSNKVKDIICSSDYDLAYHMSDYARIFRYGTGLYMYTVAFGYAVRDDDPEQFYFMIRSHFVTENEKWRKRKYFKENKRAGIKTINTLKRSINVFLMKSFYSFASRLYRKDGTHILMMTETKDYIWGNLKHIDNRIKERGLDKRFSIEYNHRTQVGQRSGVLSWFSLINKIAKQDFIFVDDYVPLFSWINLDKRTKLIQVWHAGEGFKSVGYSRFGKIGSPYPTMNSHKKYDYAIVGSEKMIHTYEEVFGLNRGAYLPLGMARLDGYLDTARIDAFKNNFYNIFPEFMGKKIILFAPTFRGRGQKFAYYDYDKLDLKAIYEFCENEYIWVFKMHPFIREQPDIPKEYRDRIKNLSEWQDINELYYVTDILITDYSSSYYDYAILRKPVLFFTYDRIRYELMRGVHKSVISTAPGKVCDSFDELMFSLKEKDYDIDKTKLFAKEQFEHYDGHAADRIIDTILLGDIIGE